MKLFKTYFTLLLVMATVFGSSVQKTSRACGIRAYTEGDTHQTLVSFDVDHPSAVTEVTRFDGLNIRAAAGHDALVSSFCSSGQ